MTKRLFEAIKAGGNSPLLFISCDDCRESSFPMAALKKSSAIEFKSIKESIEALSKKVDNYSAVEVKVNESIKMIKEQSETSKLNFADIVKKSLESKVALVSVKEAVKESANTTLNMSKEIVV